MSPINKNVVEDLNEKMEDYKADEDDLPALKISHLKVAKAHGRKGIATLLYLGAVNYVWDMFWKKDPVM